MRLCTTSAILLLGTVLSTAALAGDNADNSLVALDVSASGSVTVLGGIAAREVRLDLGPLRTGEANLPGGIISKADRMRLRAERAEARRNELDEAKR